MNAISTLLREFDAVTEAYNKAKQTVTEQLKPQFHSIFLPYLEAHPVIESLHFTAFTPYFLDGDPCTFIVNPLDATLVGEEDDYNSEFFECQYWNHYKLALEYLDTGDITYSGYMSSHYSNYVEYFTENYGTYIEYGAEKLREILAAQEAGLGLSATFSNIPDDVIEDLFGDHVRVVITRDGVDVEDYSHD